MSEMRIGEQSFTIACIRDISDRKAYTEALEHRRCTTSSPGFPTASSSAIASTRRSRRPTEPASRAALLVIDLDELQATSTTSLGHEIGDVLLQAVAERLRGVPARLRHGGSPRRGRVRHPPRSATTDWPGGHDRLEDPRGARGPVRDRRRTRSTCRRASASRLFPRARRTTSTTCCAEPTSRCTTPSNRAAGYAVFAAEQEDQHGAPAGAARRSP